MVPLLVEDSEQTLTQREALRGWPAAHLDRLGMGREGHLGQSRSTMSHASRKPVGSVGRILARSG
jgi:hypothetical protein